MDFGSMVCTASSPKCGECLLRKHCSALKAGTQEQYLRIALPQSRFEGSRRFYSGQVLRLLRDRAAVRLTALAKVIKKPVA